jgi:hypothetical protein
MNILARKFVRLTFPALALIAITACSGGGDTQPPPSPPPPPAATHLLLTAPATALARVSLPVSVTALDASNNRVTSYSGSVMITSSDGHALLPAVSVLIAGGGGTFNATLESVGAQTFTATDTVQASIAGTSPPIAVSAAPPIAITSGSPPGGKAGSAYNRRKCHPGGPCSPDDRFRFVASGGAGTITWTWAAAPGSSLPPGLSLADDLISGTPLSVGSYNIIVTATDSGTPVALASNPYTITIVNPDPPVIATLPGPPGATLNQPYSYQFQISGFAPLTVSETGALPPGLAPLTATGLLAGTPTNANSYPIQVHATDAAGQDTAQAFVIGVFQHGFSSTGGMQATRWLHTATLLASGQVLVTGGEMQAGTEITSELYAPTNGSFAATGALHVARATHTATLLCDLAAQPCTNSKVLVVGGWNATAIVGSAELYDPIAGTFTLTAGSLATGRYGHTATRLQSGKVLIAGGASGAGGVPALASAELFDPATGTFSATAAPMASARINHTATLLSDGRVLIAGGVDTDSLPLDSAELFDPVAGTFSAIAGPMTAARYGHTATLLPGGKVLIAGGVDSSNTIIATAEIYDPAAAAPAASFTPTGALVTPRNGHTAALLPSGQVLVVGGFDLGQSLRHAELYDPVSGVFESTGGMQTGRSNHTLTLLGGTGKVLVVGGDDGYSVEGFSTAEVYQ